MGPLFYLHNILNIRKTRQIFFGPPDARETLTTEVETCYFHDQHEQRYRLVNVPVLEFFFGI